jgi:hypothetical protein
MADKLPDLLGNQMDRAREAWGDSKDHAAIVQRGSKWCVRCPDAASPPPSPLSHVHLYEDDATRELLRLAAAIMP